MESRLTHIFIGSHLWLKYSIASLVSAMIGLYLGLPPAYCVTQVYYKVYRVTRVHDVVHMYALGDG